MDLMKDIIVNIRNRSGEAIKESQNALIAMLEELISEKDAAEKKYILAEKYGLKMTTELEGRIQIMCNWSEVIEEKSVKRERIAAIERMIQVNIPKEQIMPMGYTEEEYEKAESSLYVNS